MAWEAAMEAMAWAGAAAVMAGCHQRSSPKVSERAKRHWQWALALGPMALLAMAASQRAWPAAALNVFWAAMGAKALLSDRKERLAPAWIDKAAGEAQAGPAEGPGSKARPGEEG